MSSDARIARHYWLPIPEASGRSGVRHAFPGARWLGTPSETAVCGTETPMAAPSEVDWICFPSCQDCHQILKDRNDTRGC
ncbi:hypothetical protein [Saccharopolyspora tripterygii]